eukprot:TRINITY_DN5806_c0_g1_i1.p1 TRINITY_DN5806_c0_g1~~TRINITY_DN5806_c0_g1_i1.p1  ORF type:complete len:90 (+),score=8.47 TRINITY_DN5806_c0_g1_i1:151-420(+)
MIDQNKSNRVKNMKLSITDTTPMNVCCTVRTSSPSPPIIAGRKLPLPFDTRYTPGINACIVAMTIHAATDHHGLTTRTPLSEKEFHQFS